MAKPATKAYGQERRTPWPGATASSASRGANPDKVPHKLRSELGVGDYNYCSLAKQMPDVVALQEIRIVMVKNAWKSLCVPFPNNF